MSSVCLTNHWSYKADLKRKLLKETAGTVAQALFLKHINDFHVFFVGDVATAHGAEMGRLELAVDEKAAMGF